MKKKLHIPYKLNIKWLIPVTCILIAISILGIDHVKKLIYQNIYSNLNELSQQVTTQLSSSIDEQERFVEMIVDSINRGYYKTENEIFDNYKDNLGDYKFTRLVILDKNGNGITSDGYKVENYPNIEEFLGKEDVYLSENRPSIVSNDQVNIYSKKFFLIC